MERIVREVVEDLVKQHVVYAELRTTPRQYSCGEEISEKEGIDIILNMLRVLNKTYETQIRVRLIISINRSESLCAFVFFVHEIERKQFAQHA